MSRRQSPYSIEDEMNDRNEEMMSILSDKTAELRRMAGGFKEVFDNSRETVASLAMNMENSGTMMERSRRYLSTVTDDPTYYGVLWRKTSVIFGQHGLCSETSNCPDTLTLERLTGSHLKC